MALGGHRNIASYQIQVDKRVVLPSLGSPVLSVCDLQSPSYDTEWKERNRRQNSSWK